MHIQIKELGPIKEATIDLSKKLTVFCGPNGTGKTYMSYIIFALTNFTNILSKNTSLSTDVANNLLIKNTENITINIKDIWGYNKEIFKRTKSELWRLFAISQDKSEAFFKDTSIESSDSFEIFEQNLTELAFIKKVTYFDYTFILTKEKGQLNVQIQLENEVKKDKNLYFFLMDIFYDIFYSMLLFYPITDSVIFPVERNSIFTFIKELSIKRNNTFDQIQESVIKNKEFNEIDFLFKRTTRYPQPIRAGLEVAEDLENIQKRKSEYYDFALEIETELLKGKVIINKEGGVNFTSDKAPKKNLGFHQSSSIVKTLASLVIYLKHQAKENDLIIIDEPELNLHPSNQIKLARIFARLINKNLRILLSTHSDYIIRELNNLIMLSNENKAVKELGKKIGDYKADEFIHINEIGAYFFDFKKTKTKESNQVVVKNLPITETGFEVETIDTTITYQNKITEELYFSLNNGGDNE